QVGLTSQTFSADRDANGLAGLGLFGRMFHGGRSGGRREQRRMANPKRNKTSPQKSHCGKNITECRRFKAQPVCAGNALYLAVLGLGDILMCDARLPLLMRGDEVGASCVFGRRSQME